LDRKFIDTVFHFAITFANTSRARVRSSRLDSS
jgi:hypothetical protein